MVQVGSMPVAVVDRFVHMGVRMLANEKVVVSMGMNMVFVRMGMAMFVFETLMKVDVPMILSKHEPRTGYHQWKRIEE